MRLLLGFLSTMLCWQYLSSVKNEHSEQKKAYISQPEALLNRLQCASICDGELYLSYFGYTDSDSMKRCYQQCKSLQTSLIIFVYSIYNTNLVYSIMIFIFFYFLKISLFNLFFKKIVVISLTGTKTKSVYNYFFGKIILSNFFNIVNRLNLPRNQS